MSDGAHPRATRPWCKAVGVTEPPEEIRDFRAALIWLVATEGASTVRSAIDAGAKADTRLAAGTRNPGPSASLLAKVILAGKHGIPITEVVKAVGRGARPSGGMSPLQEEHRRLRSAMGRLYRGHSIEFRDEWIDAIGQACSMSEEAILLLRHQLADFKFLHERLAPLTDVHYALVRYAEAAQDPDASMALKPLDTPEPYPRLIGREDDLVEIRKLLIGSRLVTLRGAGGSGKTRLAQEVSSGTFAELPSRVGWLSLDQLAPASNIAEFAASELLRGSRKSSPALEDLEVLLSDEPYLLVLDNCEHVLSSAAALAGRLLSHCGSLRILATSLEPLGLAGERVYFVDGLATAPTDVASEVELLSYSSAELFVERARDRAGFSIAPEDVSPIQEICSQLDGIPLAIELAAGWVGIRPCIEIAAGLRDRFVLLVAQGRRHHARHQTMEETIAWSFDLLTERERIVWERLAPFSGGFTIEAARAVCRCDAVPEDAVDATLRSLEDKSLITRARADRSRLRLLESLRAFARARMMRDSDAVSALEAHRKYFLDFVLDAETQVRGQDQVSWLRRIDDDHENIRAAIASGLQDGDGESALRIAGCLWRYWRVRGYWEDGGAILANLLEEFEEPSLARARALCAAGNLAHWQQEYESANALLAEATRCGGIVGDTEWSVPFSLLIRGINMIVGELGDLEDADDLLMKSARYWRGNIGLNETDLTGLHLALYWRADCARRLGKTKRAQSLERQCRRTLEGHDDEWAKARYSFNLAVRAQDDGDSRLAEEGFERSLSFWRELGDSDGIAESLIKLAWINFEQGCDAEATERLREALPLWRALRAMSAVSDCLELAARLASRRSRHVQAVMLEGAVVRIREPMERRQLKREWEQRLHASLKPSIEALGKVYFSENQKGRGLNIDSAVNVALEAVADE